MKGGLSPCCKVDCSVISREHNESARQGRCHHHSSMPTYCRSCAPTSSRCCLRVLLPPHALLPVEPWWLPVYHGCDAAETCGLPCPAAWLAAVAREQSTESAEMTTGCRLGLKQMWLRTQHLLLPAHLTRHRLGCTLRCVMLWLGAGSGQYC